MENPFPLLKEAILAVAREGRVATIRGSTISVGRKCSPQTRNYYLHAIGLRKKGSKKKVTK
jgi:hypothetical protein